MKKGFTLVELIGVIVIIALITLLTLPPIISSMNSNKNTINDANKKLIYSAADLYISDNINAFPKYDGSVYCISVGTLVGSGLLDPKVYENETKDKIDSSKTVQIVVKNNLYEKDLVEATECIDKVVTPPVDFKIETIGTSKYIVIDTYKDGDNVSAIKTASGENVPSMKKDLKIYVIGYNNNPDSNPYSDILNNYGYTNNEIVYGEFPTPQTLINNGFNTVIINGHVWGANVNANDYFAAGLNVITIGNDSTSALSIINTSVSASTFSNNLGQYSVNIDNNITKRIGNLTSSSNDGRYLIKFIEGTEVLYKEKVENQTFDAVGAYTENNAKWVHSQVAISGSTLENFLIGSLDYVSNKNIYYYKVENHGTYVFQIFDTSGGARTIECVYN